MASVPDSLCFTDAPPIAAEVARGVTRLLCRQDLFAVCEMPLPNGRRADLMAIDAKGGLTIVEIKVAKADLIGDGKWLDYLEYCDRFFWAVPPHLAKILDEERMAFLRLKFFQRFSKAMVLAFGLDHIIISADRPKNISGGICDRGSRIHRSRSSISIAISAAPTAGTNTAKRRIRSSR